MGVADPADGVGIKGSAGTRTQAFGVEQLGGLPFVVSLEELLDAGYNIRLRQAFAPGVIRQGQLKARDRATAKSDVDTAEGSGPIFGLHGALVTSAVFPWVQSARSWEWASARGPSGLSLLREPRHQKR